MFNAVCLNCGAGYPSEELISYCKHCGGTFTLPAFSYNPNLKENLPGMWAYRRMIGAAALEPTYLGEGQTPLVKAKIAGRSLYAKLESLNPSGSFKDRNAAILTSIFRANGIDRVVEDSSGNAGAALAFYSAAFGIRAHIYIPEKTTGPKIRQIRNFGAVVVEVAGPRQNAQIAVLNAVQNESLAYASHATLPFGMAGYATIAFEIFEQLGRLPTSVICPIGHGSLFYGMMMGFEAIARFLGGQDRPKMIGVQPSVCAPLVAAWQGHPFLYQATPSLAEGTLISNPVRGAEILQGLRKGYDDLLSIEEDEIASAQCELAHGGITVEPTSAMVFAAFKWTPSLNEETNVLVFTGNGLKSEREF